MHIGIDCRTILNPRGGEFAGVGHYTQNLVTHLVEQYPHDDFVLFANETTDALAKIAKNSNVRIVHFPLQRSRRFLPLVYSHGVVARTIAGQKLDVFHGPANSIPLAYSGPSVVTVHDLAIYSHPEWFRKESPFSQKILVPQSLKKSRAIIAVSQSTADEVQRLFNVLKEKIQVVYEGGVKNKPTLFERRTNNEILFVGTLEPRKNLIRLVKAFEQLPDTQYTLILAGKSGWNNEELVETIAQSSAANRIQLRGYISAEEKIRLMQKCAVFVFPSLWEGFGLPVLEAMSVGAPVLTSNISALPEIGGDAVYYCDPNSIQSIQDGLQQLLDDEQLRQKLSKKARQRAEQFSWQRCAQETYNVYKSIV